MNFRESELPKAWHMRQRLIGIEQGIRGAVRHATTTVINVAIKRAGRNKHIARPMDLSLRRSPIFLSVRPGPQLRVFASDRLKTETGAEV